MLLLAFIISTYEVEGAHVLPLCVFLSVLN